MPDRHFRLIIDCSTDTFVLCGELDLSATEGLRRTLAAVPARSITLDLSQLSFIDSSGLACLLATAQHHDRVILRGVRPRHRRLLEIAQLRSAFELEDEGPAGGGLEVRSPTGSRSVTPGEAPPRPGRTDGNGTQGVAPRPLTSMLSMGKLR